MEAEGRSGWQRLNEGVPITPRSDHSLDPADPIQPVTFGKVWTRGRLLYLRVIIRVSGRVSVSARQQKTQESMAHFSGG